MAFFSKQMAEPVPEVETLIWICQNDHCPVWMRQGFSFTEQPLCPICESQMALETRMLPEINDM